MNAKDKRHIRGRMIHAMVPVLGPLEARAGMVPFAGRMKVDPLAEASTAAHKIQGNPATFAALADRMGLAVGTHPEKQ